MHQSLSPSLLHEGSGRLPRGRRPNAHLQVAEEAGDDVGQALMLPPEVGLRGGQLHFWGTLLEASPCLPQAQVSALEPQQQLPHPVVLHHHLQAAAAGQRPQGHLQSPTSAAQCYVQGWPALTAALQMGRKLPIPSGPDDHKLACRAIIGPAETMQPCLYRAGDDLIERLICLVVKAQMVPGIVCRWVQRPHVSHLLLQPVGNASWDMTCTHSGLACRHAGSTGVRSPAH